MKTAKDFIKEIKPNAGNLSHIMTTGQINGTLLLDIEKAMKEYAKQWVHKSVSAVIAVSENGKPPANATFEMFNEMEVGG